MKDTIISNEIIHKNDYLVYRLEKHSAGWARITYTGNDGVVLILEVDEGYVFIEHKRQTGLSLEVIRGFVENGETPEVTAVREIKEELGLTDEKLGIKEDKDLQLTYLGYGVPDNSITNRKMHYLHAKLPNIDVKDLKLQTSEGVLGYRVIPKDKIKEVLWSDDFSDVLTLSAFTKLKNI